MAEIGIQARQAVDDETGEKVPFLVDRRLGGTWGYKSGTDGTPDLAGVQVLKLTCTAGPGGGSFTINGGDSVALGANQPFEHTFEGVVTAPTIVFTGTVGFFVETIA